MCVVLHIMYSLIMKNFNSKNKQTSILFLIITIFYIQKSIGLVPSDLAIIIISQPNNFNSNLSNIIKTNLLNQINFLYANDENNGSNNGRTVGDGEGEAPPQILMTHEQFPNSINAWTVIGVLKKINAKLNLNTKWIVFCDERCHIDIKILLANLNAEPNEFIGYPLYDEEPTIIHHFDSIKSFFYPNLSSGIIFEYRFFRNWVLNVKITETSFTIDPIYEMTKLLWNKGKGQTLAAVPYLCSRSHNYTSDNTNCAIYDKGYPKFENFVELNKIIFTIKTCAKYHSDRMSVILSTWGKYVKHIRYYSDAEDVSIPTIPTGIPNTENGHCEKTFKIFQMVLDEISTNRELSEIEWIVLADDDTILSPSRLAKLLHHFQNEKHICLGQRYGFDVLKSNGYNYITGGGGIVFNVNTLRAILNYCYCPNINSPDDMIIGSCLAKLNINLIHSSLFHQARKKDYAAETLLYDQDISFHKHWLIDPHYFYDKTFAKEDAVFYQNQHIKEKSSEEQLKDDNNKFVHKKVEL